MHWYTKVRRLKWLFRFYYIVSDSPVLNCFVSISFGFPGRRGRELFRKVAALSVRRLTALPRTQSDKQKSKRLAETIYSHLFHQLCSERVETIVQIAH
jgi:hypothetical protein